MRSACATSSSRHELPVITVMPSSCTSGDFISSINAISAVVEES
jgi:hypothetical protein